MGCRVYYVRFESLKSFSSLQCLTDACIPPYRMGTSAMKAGSSENFTKIDKEYVVSLPSFAISTAPVHSSLGFLTCISVSAHLFRLFRYVVNAAKTAKADKDQRLIYVSVRFPFEPVGFSSHIIIYLLQSAGANPKSSFLYPRSKGLTEQALAELGYKDTVVFRPAGLSNTNRPESRFVERAFLYAPLPLFFCPTCLPYRLSLAHPHTRC